MQSIIGVLQSTVRGTKFRWHYLFFEIVIKLINLCDKSFLRLQRLFWKQKMISYSEFDSQKSKNAWREACEKQTICRWAFLTLLLDFLIIYLKWFLLHHHRNFSCEEKKFHSICFCRGSSVQEIQFKFFELHKKIVKRSTTNYTKFRSFLHKKLILFL